MTRNVTSPGVQPSPDPTPSDPEMEEDDRYRLYSLCPCENCGNGIGMGTGKVDGKRCPDCRGEGRSLSLIATATSKEAVGVALVTLAEEGEWDGDCPLGLMDRPAGQKGRWLIKPWQASARNVSDAGRTLALSRHRDIITKEDR